MRGAGFGVMRKAVGLGKLQMGESLDYWQFMKSLFDIQVLPLEDTSGTAARDVGARGINGTYANITGLQLAQSLRPFTAPVLGATSYVNHNPASIASFFSYLAGTYHFWVKGSLALWDDAASRRLVLLQVDTSNRIDLTKNAATDTLRFDYRAGGVSNYKDIPYMTYSSGWFPICLRWNKAGDVLDIFVNGRKVDTISGLGNIVGSVTNASIGGNTYFPGGSLAYLGLGSGLVSDANISLLASKIYRDKLIVCHGDSLTTGQQAGAVPYPKQLIRLYAGDTPVPNCVGYNKGESGKKVLDLIGTAGANVDSYIGDGTFIKKICVFLGGTNDITTGSDAATVEGRIETYCQARKAAGWRVVVCTIIPNGVHTAGQQTVRTDVNAWIRANHGSFANGLVDLCADAAFNEQADTANATNYNADGTHLTTAGYGLLAGMVKPVVDAL